MTTAIEKLRAHAEYHDLQGSSGEADVIRPALAEHEALLAAHASALAEVERLRAAVGGGRSRRWYVYDPECGWDTYATPGEAKAAAETSIEQALDGDTGWHENITDVEWGMLVPFQEVVLNSHRPMTPEERERWDESVAGEIFDYGLRNTSVPAPTDLRKERDSAIAALENVLDLARAVVKDADLGYLGKTPHVYGARLYEMALAALAPAASAEPVGGDVPWPDPPTEYEKLQSRDDYEARHGVRLDGEESASAPGRGAGT